MEKKDEWFVIKDGRITHKETTRRCYFCGIGLPKIIHEHHIIRKVDGGSNDADNLLFLCTRCHSLIHKRVCILRWVRPGYYLLVKKDDIHFIVQYPSHQEIGNRRKPPIKDIAQAKNLFIEEE